VAKGLVECTVLDWGRYYKCSNVRHREEWMNTLLLRVKNWWNAELMWRTGTGTVFDVVNNINLHVSKGYTVKYLFPVEVEGETLLFFAAKRGK
jgi:hypothetical protein